MKLKYKPVEKDLLSSIYVERVHQPYVGGNWHFHKEFEIICFLEGQGTRIVGDHISNFQKGELVMVGEWLPHLWRNDVGMSGVVDSDFIVIKFRKDFEGVDIFSLPELSEIRSLMKRSYRGILFPESVLPKIQDIILQLCESNSSLKIINFLKILQILSEEKDYQFLSSPNFSLTTQISDENRLQKVINYISTNYTREISLEEIAEIAIMTPPAFCRFFKTRTNKTFSLFVNEVRVSKACQLLINGENSMKQICFKVGFGSLTNFNRTFRNFKGMAPSSYRANYRVYRENIS